MFEGQRGRASVQDRPIRPGPRARMSRPRLPEEKVVSLAKEVLLEVAARTAPEQRPQPTADQIDALCDALVSGDETAGLRLLTDIGAIDASVEGLYADYLAVAAERLGVWWNEGRMSFADVTIGSGRIYGIMRTIRTPQRRMFVAGGKSALFAAAPDETHTLGLSIAADLFRRAGWDIELLIGTTEPEILAAVEKGNHRLVGLSCAGIHGLSALERLVGALRKSPVRPYVLLCGQILNEPAEVIEAIGADGVAGDVDTAMAKLDEIRAKLWSPAVMVGSAG
jgi:methanogenic corrinoid protein MtbC1